MQLVEILTYFLPRFNTDAQPWLGVCTDCLQRFRNDILYSYFTKIVLDLFDCNYFG